jgi:hypothetical protein
LWLAVDVRKVVADPRIPTANAINIIPPQHNYVFQWQKAKPVRSLDFQCTSAFWGSSLNYDGSIISHFWSILSFRRDHLVRKSRADPPLTDRPSETGRSHIWSLSSSRKTHLCIRHAEPAATLTITWHGLNSQIFLRDADSVRYSHQFWGRSPDRAIPPKNLTLQFSHQYLQTQSVEQDFSTRIVSSLNEE